MKGTGTETDKKNICHWKIHLLSCHILTSDGVVFIKRRNGTVLTQLKKAIFSVLDIESFVSQFMYV